MKGIQGSQVVKGIDDTHLFPLSWTDNLLAIARYDYKYLTSGEDKMFLLLEKFVIIECRVVIKRC